MFAGWQSNAEVRQHLRTARALIMPSFAENLPVAMMEAFALGRPVVGTYIAGVPELVESGVNGWLIPAGNVDATAEAILQVLRSVGHLMGQPVGASSAHHDASIRPGGIAHLDVHIHF
jgi:glycosyltransferase involved in cell wall biosynthesis